MPGKLYRHGDVLIQEIETLPGGGARGTDAVLAYGEVTGHAHRIENPEAVEIWRSPEMRWTHGVWQWMRVLEPTRVVHEEHAPISLEPGVYRFWQQREYAPPGQGMRLGGVSFRTVRD